MVVVKALIKANFIPTQDAQCEYWQVSIKNEDEDKALITSQLHTHGYTCMLFGLQHPPVTFQSTIAINLFGAQ